MLKIHMGTPKGRNSICKMCANAQNVRGLDLQETVICNAVNPSRRVTFPVETCTLFTDSRLPSLDDMRKIAWTVETRNRGKWGFASGVQYEVTIEPPRHDGQDVPAQPATGYGKQTTLGTQREAQEKKA